MTGPVETPVAAPRPPPSALRIGRLRLASRYLLSPLAGFTNLSFRRAIRELGGAGLCTTDLVNARSLLAKRPKALELIQTCPADRPLAIQIFGHEPGIVADAARLLETEFDLDSVDINMGCPVARIAHNGAGAAMMKQTDATISLVREVVEAVELPVTVKMRLGWDSQSLTAPWFAAAFEKIGVAAITIHGRTREQGFSGQVSLDGIRRVVEAVETIPVIGNGDIRCVADAARMIEVTGCDGVSIGRGALANPWIFRQLVQWEHSGSWDPAGDFDDRLTLLLRQFDFLVEQKGIDRAVVSFRRMIHWYLKSMRVRRGLRHRFQQVQTRQEFDAAIERVRVEGPRRFSRSPEPAVSEIPVPAGPNAHW